MTGILFIARLGSTRLSQKHLIKANEKTFIEWLILRFAQGFEKEISSGTVKLIVATSNQPENKKFETVLKDIPVSVFYGNDQNIPMRQLECARSYELDNIISIDGDDILCSCEAAMAVLEKLKQGEFQYVKTTGLPLGMNVMGYKTLYLEEVLKNSAGDKLETGWGRIFNEADCYTIQSDLTADIDALRLTLDYQEDANFFKAVIEKTQNAIVSISDSELIKVIISQKLYEINSQKNDVYWENFNRQKSSETSGNTN